MFKGLLARKKLDRILGQDLPKDSIHFFPSKKHFICVLEGKGCCLRCGAIITLQSARARGRGGAGAESGLWWDTVLVQYSTVQYYYCTVL